MAVPVIMPRQGQSVESCIISQWHKKKGDTVKKGDLLFTYETDKASFDEEASMDGILLEIFFKEGDDVPVLTTVCVVGEKGEDTVRFLPRDETPGKEPEPGENGPKAGDEKESRQMEGEENNGLKSAGVSATGISPRAKSLAAKLGVDLSTAEGSGPQGRIIEKDVRRLRDEGRIATKAASGRPEAWIPITGTGLGGRITTGDTERAREQGTLDGQTTKPAAMDGGKPRETLTEAMATGGYEDMKLPNIRRVIARTMHHSLMSAAQLTMNASFDATTILGLRKKIKTYGKEMGLSNITLNDMILYVVSRVLPDFRELNAHFLDETIRIFKDVNLGVAVHTERGLMVPTIFKANKKTLNEISMEAKNLAEKCRNRTIQPDELKGGTFTVTNLGTFGIESFTPILNPPQTGILGVNGIVRRVRDAGEGICTYPAMGLSLTIDHRAVDGAPAARFMERLAKGLENMELFFLLRDRTKNAEKEMLQKDGSDLDDI